MHFQYSKFRTLNFPLGSYGFLDGRFKPQVLALPHAFQTPFYIVQNVLLCTTKHLYQTMHFSII